MRNRGVNDPTWRARGRPAPHSGVVHATVPGVHFADREVGIELAIEVAGIDHKLVPAQIIRAVTKWGRYLDARLLDFEAQGEVSRKADPFLYDKLAEVRREAWRKADD